MANLQSPASTQPGVMSPVAFSLASTVGAVELGVLLAIFLSGVLTVQVYVYFNGCPTDPWNFKFMVIFAYILDLGHTIAICHCIYTITVTQYGEPQLLSVPPLSLDVAILLSGLMGPLEQGWFTYRLYKFTKTLLLPLICAILSLLRLAGSTALFIISLYRATIDEYRTRQMWLIEAVVIVGALVDVILVVALCYYLSFWRTGGFQRMSKLVRALMTLAIETGAITSAGAIALLVTFLTMRENFVYLACFVILAKLYANSLLFSLNARERFARICSAQGIATPSLRPLNSRMSLQPWTPLSPLSPALRIQTDLAPASPKRRSNICFAESPREHTGFLVP
ncbi:hypothetical protein FB451DRAFT_1301456 [Mycena latifolia]|nr:hypothetical protein FB451DRAFT_1301456 [Mycena latifolia]